MKFKITINDNEYHADMVDCDLVNQIADMCPFEVTFKQHRNQEYFTKLPSQANDDGCPLTTTILKNKLYYYQQWNAFVIVYEDTNVSPYELTYVGEFDEDVSEYLQQEETFLLKWMQNNSIIKKLYYICCI